MGKIIIFLISLSITTNAHAWAKRFSIGANTLAAGALLHLESSTKGAIFAPRMSTAARDNINEPTPGLGVFDTTEGKLSIYNAVSGWLYAAYESIAQTLTNKTIDGDDNTLQDINISSLKVSANTSVLIGRNQLGEVIDTDISIPEGSFVTESGDQTLSNKKISGSLVFNGSSSGSVAIKAPASPIPYTITWPAAQGGPGEIFENDGSGVLSWVTPSAVPSFTTISTSSTTFTPATSGEDNLALNPTSTATVSLPTASGNNGLTYKITKIATSSNTLTIDPNGSETIDDQTTIKLVYKGQNVIIASDGSSWNTYSPHLNTLLHPNSATGDGFSVLVCANIAADGTVSNEDDDFISGNCSVSSGTLCTYTSNYWENPSNIRCSPTQENATYQIRTSHGASSLTVIFYDNSDVIQTDAVWRVCCIGRRK